MPKLRPSRNRAHDFGPIGSAGSKAWAGFKAWAGLGTCPVRPAGLRSARGRRTRAARLAAFARPTTVPFPAENPYSADKAELGRMLFFDSAAVGLRHHLVRDLPSSAAGLGRRPAAGDRRGPVSLPLPLAHRAGRGLARGVRLGRQVPDPGERRVHADDARRPIWAAPSRRCCGTSPPMTAYRAAFDQVFPGEGVYAATVERALATYERTIVPAIAPFDRWVQAMRPRSEMPPTRLRPVHRAGRLRRVPCRLALHRRLFHDIGIGGEDGYRPRPAVSELGAAAPCLQGADACATWRARAPYMHDGSLPTLASVIALVRPAAAWQSQSHDPAGSSALALSASERDDLIAFLQSLTGADVRAGGVPRRILLASSLTCTVIRICRMDRAADDEDAWLGEHDVAAFAGRECRRCRRKSFGYRRRRGGRWSRH